MNLNPPTTQVKVYGINSQQKTVAAKMMLFLQQHRPSFGLLGNTHLLWHFNNIISQREKRTMKSSSAKSE